MNDNQESCKDRAHSPKSSRHKYFFHHRLKKNLLWFLFVFHLSGSWDEMKRAQVRPAARGAAVARVVLILWIRWCLWQIQMFSYLLTSVGPTAATPSVRPQIHSDPLWSTQQRISDTRPSAGYRNRPSLSKYKPVQSTSIKRINNHQCMWARGNVFPIIFT